jgi:capsular exopolysaccharide synthesis family protein
MIVSIKLAIPEGSVYSEELGNFLGTQAALMRSGVVMNRAQASLLARDPGIPIPPISLKVGVSPKTSIFVLEALGNEPKCVQSFLQACMEEYIKLKKEMRTQTSDATVAGLTEEVLRLEKELRVSEDELAGFQRSNSVILLQEQGSSFGTYVATLNQRLAALRAEDALLQSFGSGQGLPTALAILAPAEFTHPATDLAVSWAQNDPQDTEGFKARQQILLLKAEQQDLGRYLRPKHPKMVALGEDIARRETMLNILRQQSAGELESRKASLARQIVYLEQNLAECNAKALDCSQKMAEYQRLKGNQQRIQTLYDRLLATLQTLDLNREISPESVTILEPASPPTPDGHNPLNQLITAGLIAVAVSVGLILFLDHVDDRIHSFNELQNWLDETVLAQVPLQRPGGKGKEVKSLEPNDSRHAFVEAFRSLRSSLLFQSSEKKAPKVLLVTSSIPSEGKSLTSVNLAVTMASANARVLLVDADLRKGVLNKRLGLTPTSGLSEVLSEQVSWEHAVVSTPYAGLALLPRGAPTMSSGELFLAEPARRFLAEAALKYDFVILDAAPVMAADDVTSLAPRADAVLFVVRAEHTSARVVRTALEMLYRRQVSVIGVVFNAVRPNQADYYAYTV